MKLTIEVPDGDKCEGCTYLTFRHGACFCSIFDSYPKDSEGEPATYEMEAWKLAQCLEEATS